MKAVSDLAGKHFGRLVALEICGISKHRNALWKCQCDCGNTTVTQRGELIQGKTNSCGCLRIEKLAKGNPKHGFAGTNIYQLWGSMIDRCMNPNCNAFPRYGGRGIAVCERWKRFENFYADMGPRPPGLSLERKDNDGPYDSANCKWATRREQNRNTSRTRKFVIDGVSKCLSEWASHFGINYETLRSRLGKGLSLAEAIKL